MAPMVDNLFNFVLWVSIVSFALIVFGMVYFTIKYSRKKRSEHHTLYVTGHTPLEMGISFVLLVLVMIIFYWGWKDYKMMKMPPADALEINVIAKQWLWQFQYSDGRLLTNELVVPKGKAVNLIMTSQDVLHSLFMPTFRIKQDVVPNTYTSLWFIATEAGEQPIYCAEYCGTGHSAMLGKVRVLEPDDFEDWMNNPEAAAVVTTASATPAAAKPASLADVGVGLYNSKGCSACHSVTGSVLVGPSFKGIFGQTIELADGKKAVVDENYIRESIMEPQAKLVKGFQPIMPTFKGQLKDEEVNALIAYIKSLK